MEKITDKKRYEMYCTIGTKSIGKFIDDKFYFFVTFYNNLVPGFNPKWENSELKTGGFFAQPQPANRHADWLFPFRR
jgi:hypothetical protein